MSHPAVVVLATGSSAGPWPYVVGGLILFILFGAMLVLLGIGGGREHS